MVIRALENKESRSARLEGSQSTLTNRVTCEVMGREKGRRHKVIRVFQTVRKMQILCQEQA